MRLKVRVWVTVRVLVQNAVGGTSILNQGRFFSFIVTIDMHDKAYRVAGSA